MTAQIHELSSRRPPSVPAIHQALRRGVDDDVFPGGAAAVFADGKLVHLSATGDAQRVPEQVGMTSDALFDLASLTKVLATTTSVAALLGRRALSLDDVASRYVPAFARAGKKAVTVRQLLAHSSGLPAWTPLFLRAMQDPAAKLLFTRERGNRAQVESACERGRAVVLDGVWETPLERPSGSAAVYSDLGFIALGAVVEAIAGERLDRFAERDVFGELGLSTLAFRPLGAPQRAGPPIVATGVVRPREPAAGQEKLLPAPDFEHPDCRPGEVDDDNAFAMGGVAGHAGLFGSARDVAALGQAVLDELAGGHRLAPPEVWRGLVTRDGTAGTTRALGFDTPSETGSSAGALVAKSRAVGHTGFTGTSLWVDLDRKLSIALLTNRVHPRRGNETIRAFRPAFHDAVVEALAP